jgi:hypothetical protein
MLSKFQTANFFLPASVSVKMSSPQTKSSSYPVLYSSGIGSVSAVLVSTPFDVVKNYMQVCTCFSNKF